jgi:hypothetical protein
MEKQERELLIKTCDLLLEMAEMQRETYHSMRALSQVVRTRLPGVEEEFEKARTEALFANKVSIRVNKLIGEIEDALACLKTSGDS